MSILKNHPLGLILKVLLLSTALSYGVKYGGRILSLNPSNSNALIAIFLPTVILAIALWWRSNKRWGNFEG